MRPSIRSPASCKTEPHPLTSSTQATDQEETKNPGKKNKLPVNFILALPTYTEPRDKRGRPLRQVVPSVTS